MWPSDLFPITSAMALKSLPYFLTPCTASNNSSFVHLAFILVVGWKQEHIKSRYQFTNVIKNPSTTKQKQLNEVLPLVAWASRFLTQFCACACSKVVYYFEPKMNKKFSHAIPWRFELKDKNAMMTCTIHDSFQNRSYVNVFILLTVLLSDTISASRFFNNAAPCPGGPVAIAFKSCKSRYIPRGGFLLFFTLWRNDWALFGPGLLFNNFWPPSVTYKLYYPNYIFINATNTYSIPSFLVQNL